MGEAPQTADLPPPEVALFLLGATWRALERRYPGFVEEVVRELQDDAWRASVIRLRGQRATADVLAKMDSAVHWAEMVRLNIGDREARRLREAKPWWKRFR